MNLGRASAHTLVAFAIAACGGATPEPVIAQLNRTVNEILALPSIEKQMIGQGADPVGGTPAEFGQFVQREYEKWKLVVRESGATAE